MAVHIGSLNNGDGDLGKRLRGAKYRPVAAKIIAAYTGKIEQTLMAKIPKFVELYAIKMSPGAKITEIPPTTEKQSVYFFLPEGVNSINTEKILNGIVESLNGGIYVSNTSSEDVFLLVMIITSKEQPKRKLERKLERKLKKQLASN